MQRVEGNGSLLIVATMSKAAPDPLYHDIMLRHSDRPPPWLGHAIYIIAFLLMFPTIALVSGDGCHLLSRSSLHSRSYIEYAVADTSIYKYIAVASFIGIHSMLIYIRGNDGRSLSDRLADGQVASAVHYMILAYPMYRHTLVAVCVVVAMIYAAATWNKDEQHISTKDIISTKYKHQYKQEHNRWKCDNKPLLAFQKKARVANAKFYQKLIYGWYTFSVLSPFNIYHKTTDLSFKTNIVRTQLPTPTLVPKIPISAKVHGQTTMKDMLPSLTQILFQDTSGSTFTINNIDESDTVASLMFNIYHKTNIPMSRQRLVLDSVELCDPMATLSSIGLADGDTIHMAVYGRGGMPTVFDEKAAVASTEDKESPNNNELPTKSVEQSLVNSDEDSDGESVDLSNFLTNAFNGTASSPSKRVSGTAMKSPHKSTGYSPMKKKSAMTHSMNYAANNEPVLAGVPTPSIVRTNAASIHSNVFSGQGTGQGIDTIDVSNSFDVETPTPVKLDTTSSANNNKLDLDVEDFIGAIFEVGHAEPTGYEPNGYEPNDHSSNVKSESALLDGLGAWPSTIGNETQAQVAPNSKCSTICQCSNNSRGCRNISNISRVPKSAAGQRYFNPRTHGMQRRTGRSRAANAGNTFATHTNGRAIYNKLSDKQFFDLYRKFKGDPELCVHIPTWKSPSSRDRSFTEEERLAVEGPAGLLKRRCPYYRRNPEGSENRVTASGSDHQVVATYYCGCRTVGCRYEMKIVRVSNGIVGLEKVDENGVVDHSCHDIFPAEEATTKGSKKKREVDANGNFLPDNREKRVSKRVTAGALSGAQKIYLIQNYIPGKPDDVVSNMVGDPTLHISEQQDKDTLKTKVKGFYKGKSSKKFFHKNSKQPLMSVEILEEIAELLETRPDLRTDVAPIGKSGNPFYSTSAWLGDDGLWKNINVVDHDVNSYGSGTWSYLMFMPNNAIDIASAASKMFPGGHVQLEVDFFKLKGKHTSWQVGHVGVSDFAHRYWPLVYIVTQSEKETTATKLLEFARDLVEIAGGGTVNVVMADGGKALETAIGNLNKTSQWHTIGSNASESNNLVVAVRRCFAHVIRMPLTRGGGYRGGRGSLPRYLLQQKVPHDVMAKIMSAVIAFNFIPDQETYRVAMQLLISEYKDHLNEHVLEHYLDPEDPLKLGGRAAGYQGQVGSNNGGERRGGNLKNSFRSLVQNMIAAEKGNFVHFMHAVARENWIGHDPSTFAAKPVRTMDHYNIVRDVLSWSENRKINAKVSCDWVYMICTNEEGKVVSVESVLGNPSASCTFYMPTARLVYSTLKEMRMDEVESMECASYHSKAAKKKRKFDINSTKEDDWLSELSQLNASERTTLKERLVAKFKSHTVNAMPGERLWDYLGRCAQRLPQEKKDSIIVSDKSDKSCSKRRLEKLTKEKAAKEDEDKWMENVGAIDEPELDTGIDVPIDEDFDEEQIREILSISFKEFFDENESETLRMALRQARVHVRRQLGHWVKVEVNSITRTVRCNCEKCNTDGVCEFAATFEEVQFSKGPPADCVGIDEALTWNADLAEVREKLKNVCINILDKEGVEPNNLKTTGLDDFAMLI